MSEQQQPQKLQVNLGESQRNAGHDYHEVLALQSMELFLAVTPQDEIDRLTLDNVNLFRHRFGFEAARRSVREQVLAIRQVNEYTDREICWMRRAGQLRIRRDRAWLVQDRSMLVVGWIQIGAIALVSMTMIFAIAFSTAPAWKQAIGQAVVVAACFAAMWVLNKLYIEPWRLARAAIEPASSHTQPR